MLVAAVDCSVELVTRLLRDNADIDHQNHRGLSARKLLQKVYGLTIDQLYVFVVRGQCMPRQSIGFVHCALAGPFGRMPAFTCRLLAK